MARLNDDLVELRRISQVIEAGNKLWESFAQRSEGQLCGSGGDEGAVSVEATHLGELPLIAQQYADSVGATVSVGIGMKLSESSKAVLIAKLRGKNQIVLWEPSMQAEIDAVKPQNEADKLADEYLLNKGGEGSGRYDHHLHGIRDKKPGEGHPAGNKGAHAGFGGHHVPHRLHGQHEQGTDAVKQAVEAKHAQEALKPDDATAFEGQFHDIAGSQDQEDQQTAHAASGAKDDLRQQLATILSNLRQKGPIISQLQDVDPEAYQAILQLVQGVIALTKEIVGPNPEPTQDDSQPVQKSEGLEKTIESLGSGPIVNSQESITGPADRGVTGTKIVANSYDYSHLLPQHAKDAGMRLEVHHKYKVEPSFPRPRGEQFQAHLLLPGETASSGNVTAHVRRAISNDPGPDEAIEPHSELDPALRGKGLGMAMYEAVFAHAKNVRGISHVEGGVHSAAADAVHKRLAAKHGFDYQAELDAPNDKKYPYGGYSYAIKQELEPDQDIHLIGPGRGVVFRAIEGAELDKSGGPIPGAPPQHHLNLPEGSEINGKIKVRHSDQEGGGESWVEVRSGKALGTDNHVVPAAQTKAR